MHLGSNKFFFLNMWSQFQQHFLPDLKFKRSHLLICIFLHLPKSLGQVVSCLLHQILLFIHKSINCGTSIIALLFHHLVGVKGCLPNATSAGFKPV